MPLSPKYNWEEMKMMVRRPKPMKRPIMWLLFQAYWEPPHWRARRRQTTVGMRMKVPIRSSWAMRFRMVRFLGLLLREILRMKRTTPTTMAPIGRLGVQLVKRSQQWLLSRG
jgi:hypothetical protein